MREFPATVSSHVHHLNSSASNLLDDDESKLPTIESDINGARFHQTAKQQQQKCNNNKNTANYICTSNGDLTSLQSGHLNNFSNINNIHNNDCNRSHKIAVKSDNDRNVELFGERDRGDNIDGNRATNNGNTSYSIFDAITNAVTGHCANTIYPSNDQNDSDFDQNNLDKMPTSTSMHNLKNTSIHMNKECGQFQHHNHHPKTTRKHQFPSANYKHSYLLWIGTPVAAR